MTGSRRFPYSRGLQQVAGIGVHAMRVSAVAMASESAAALVSNGTRSACVLETLAIAHLWLVQRVMAAGRMTMSAKICMRFAHVTCQKVAYPWLQMLESDMELGIMRPIDCAGGGGRNSGQPPAAGSSPPPSCPKMARRTLAALATDCDSTSCASSIILSSFSMAFVCLAARKAFRAALDMEWGLKQKYISIN